MSWTIKKSKELYSLLRWGGGYFDINTLGNLEVAPKRSKKKIDLYQLTKDLSERGIEAPILIRFPEILTTRIQLLTNCFQKAIKEYSYKGKFCCVYPIKVNQQKHIIKDIVHSGNRYYTGLECGSKPELLLSLSMASHHSPIICNGFKDEDYMKTALLAQKIGKNVFIVIDRKSELPTLIELSKKLKLTPQIGLRVKLSSNSSSRWNEAQKYRGKFGLSSSETVSSIELLKKHRMIDALRLVHFHMGSQVRSIFSIKDVLKEGAQFFTEIYKLGARPSVIDVGGGLGVNYSGQDQGAHAINYTEQEYANDVVFTIQTACEQNKVPHPTIITESGRSLVAHSSVLIFDVLSTHDFSSLKKVKESKGDIQAVKDLFYIYKNVSKNNLNEYTHDLLEKNKDILQLFRYGHLNLKQRAKAEDLFFATCQKILTLTEEEKENSQITEQIKQELTATYFGNFSIFQSLPDSWAIDQVFPVLPIHRLNTEPTVRAIVADLTCDADGKINQFISKDKNTEQKNYLMVHPLNKKNHYYLGVFLTGAYQEILGDLHNLFGDTNAVHITTTANSYEVKGHITGDSIAKVLNYVEYNENELIESIRKDCEKSLQKKKISYAEARSLMRNYKSMIDSYTYLQKK